MISVLISCLFNTHASPINPYICTSFLRLVSLDSKQPISIKVQCQPQSHHPLIPFPPSKPAHIFHLARVYNNQENRPSTQPIYHGSGLVHSYLDVVKTSTPYAFLSLPPRLCLQKRKGREERRRIHPIAMFPLRSLARSDRKTITTHLHPPNSLPLPAAQC